MVETMGRLGGENTVRNTTRSEDKRNDVPGIVVIGADDLSMARAALQSGQTVSLFLNFALPNIDWEAVIQLADQHEGLQVSDSVEREPPQLLAIADCLIRLAGYRLALPLLNRTLEKEPGNAGAYSLKAICLFYLGRLEETVACLDKAVELVPKLESETYVLHREALRLQEKYTDDSEGLKHHLACEIQHELARTYKTQGDQEKALVCYDRSLAINHNNPQSWSMKGGLLQSMGRKAEAQACFGKILEIPIDEESRLQLFSRGVALLYTGHFAEAMHSFEKALTLDPNYSQAKQNWFASFGQWMNALPRERPRLQHELETVQSRLQEEPRDVTLLVMQGAVLMLLDRWGEAASVFNEASTIVDERPVKRFGLFNHIDPFVQWARASQITKQLQKDFRPFLASAGF